ncbi:MAG TPA: trehalose-6-phosphate synthase, partial [Rhodanobacteraceae bacterium]
DLMPEMLRQTRPDLFVHHFTHIPWPQPDAWRVLPSAMREAIFHGLLGSDIVGFHTTRYVRNFLLGCEELVGAAVDFSRGIVYHDGREVLVRSYPISVDADALRELARSDEIGQRRTEIAEIRREQLIVRVDRTDPAKNIVRGFHAFAELLHDHPELRGRVTFLALLQPSRQDIPQYAAYLQEIRDTVAAVNARFGEDDWKPIELRVADDLPMAVAAYTEYNVLLVNPVSDGMNLVAKEGLLVNENDGVLALSENAGAHAELGAIALTVHPFDIEQQARTLYQALTMPAAERRVRREVGAEIVCNNDVQKWLRRQLADIDSTRSRSATRVR